MTRARRTGRRAAWLCALGALVALDAPSYAQTTTPTATTPPFEDRYIADGKLSPDISSGDYSTSETTGLARSIRVDGVVSVLNQEGPNAPPATHEDGFIMDAQWDTVSYGAWSADAAARTGGSSGPGIDGNASASFSLHERALPFDGGWQADNAIGDINAPLINLASAQPRFILAQAPMEGVDTVWRGPSGLELVAGAGEPGIYSGIKVPVFDGLGGSTGTLGAQWAPASQWTLGGEFATARDTSLYYQPLVNAPYGVATNERISSTTSYLTAAWQDGPSRAQLNVIDGSVNGDGNSLGVWLDTSRASGAVTQSVGAFRFDPNLAWGNQLIASDVEGGYYRVDYQSRRWLADFGVDQVNSVSGIGSNTTFLTGDTRYQLTRDTGIGGAVNLSRSDSDPAWSAEAYLDHGNSYGTGRGQLDYATDPQAHDATFTLEQTWNMPAGERLATTAAIDEIRSSTTASLQQDSTVVRVAVYGGGDLTARLALNATVEWATAVHGEAAPSRSADVSLTYQLSRSWSVFTDYYESRIGSWTPLVVTSPLTAPTPTVIPTAGERGVFLTVRYQESRGSHFVPLGGAFGSGSGRLGGVVYLDANENGRYDAGEAGAANVTVVLDGRFSVRTDANGRFDFPAVAAGHHVLSVETDNLPLPWTLSNSGRTEVNVSTRERTEVNIGAVRMK